MSDVYTVFSVGTIYLFIQRLLKVKIAWYLPTVNICDCELSFKKISVELLLREKFPKVGAARKPEMLRTILTR